MEIWKPVLGYEKEYEVSSYGRVRSLDKPVKTAIRHSTIAIRRGKVLKANTKRGGYVTVDLSSGNNKKTVPIHRLVAKAFIPPVNGKIYVNHKNGIKTDNRVKNLEWCTASENSKHRFETLGHTAPLAKKIMCVETQRIFDSSTKAAEWLNQVHFQHSKQVKAMGRRIRGCATGLSKTAYGYHWKDVNV